MSSTGGYILFAMVLGFLAYGCYTVIGDNFYYPMLPSEIKEALEFIGNIK